MGAAGVPLHRQNRRVVLEPAALVLQDGLVTARVMDEQRLLLRADSRQKRMFSAVMVDRLLRVAAIAAPDAYAVCPFTSRVTPGFSAQKASSPAISSTLGNGSG
ncbi:hypothetical protein SAMN05421874_106147 [Nonomuraea maritima]|uniref:Uncharacterized protein n=1 Tax=Nonomuraea maritima TaxID=683260 RepID=A0A1G9ADG0_9ACTN|nr:hypothetical protein SAMN05421874_106147 [Nonomuraea maritima]